MAEPAPWAPLFEGHVTSVDTDVLNVVDIEREVIPVIFVPGVMGSRLKRTRLGRKASDTRMIVWDTDELGFKLRLLRTRNVQLRDQLIGGDKFDNTYLSVIGRTAAGAVDLEDQAAYADGDHFPAGGFERGWAGVSQDTYLPILREIEGARWSEPVRHCFELPVHAFGYNWSQSNTRSGNQLADYVRQTIKDYEGRGRFCRHAILVTHSMGGLVARQAIRALRNAGSRALLGVVHGAQPASGAPDTYWRMKGGFTGFIGYGLGKSGKSSTLILGNMPGVLGLLPNKRYRTNPTAEHPEGDPAWLTYPDPGTGVVIRLPNGGTEGALDPYQEIYRERTRFFRLINERWLDVSARIDHRDTNYWNYYLEYLAHAEAYYDLNDEIVHEDTVQFYATGLNTVDRIEFSRRRRGILSIEWEWQFLEAGYRRGVEADGSVTAETPGAGRPEWLMYLELPTSTGDETVPDSAGRYLDLGDDGRTVAITSDHEWAYRREHAAVYKAGTVQHVTRKAIENFCLQRIAAEVGPAPGVAPPPAAPPPTGPPPAPPRRVVQADRGTAAARKAHAEAFYATQKGYPPGRVENHVTGIDLDRTVEVVELPTGTVLAQWQAPGAAQGDYYAELGTAAVPLGISPKAESPTGGRVDRVVVEYETTRPVLVLRSTSASILDTWSFKPSPYFAEGGATQYFAAPHASAFDPRP